MSQQGNPINVGTQGIIDSGPPGDDDDARRPIGVPPGFTPTKPVYGPFAGDNASGVYADVHSYRAAVPLQHFAGDEWRPGSLTPAEIAELQADLVEAGLLKPNSYSRGAWGPESAAAYEKVLSASNASGLPASMMLDRFKSGRPPDESAKRAPNVVALTHPDDIRDMVNQTAVRTIGRNLRDDEVEPLINTFQQYQRDYQRALYAADAEGAPAESEVVEPPDFESEAKRRIRAANPQEAAQSGAMQRQQEFLSLLGSVGGGGLR